MMKIAAQLYTIRDLIKDQPKEVVASVLGQLKAGGFDCVQISGVGDITKDLAKMYQEICTTLELQICGTHLSFEFLEKEIDWVIKYHQLWSCEFIGIGSMPGEFKTGEGIIEFAKRCNKLGEKLKSAGLQLIYHNHKFEFEKIGDQTWMDLLYKHFDSEFVEFELDTYWVQAGGCSPVDWINKVNNRMRFVHFKDFRILNDEQQFAELGKGNLDWPNIIEACKSIQVLYAAIEQDAFTDDPLQSLIISYNYITQYDLG